MKLLTHILYKVNPIEIIGNSDIYINQIQFDSRKVNENDVFIAINGTQLDGHQFINTCIKSGAKVIVCEHLPEQLTNGITYN